MDSAVQNGLMAADLPFGSPVHALRKHENSKFIFSNFSPGEIDKREESAYNKTCCE